MWIVAGMCALLLLGGGLLVLAQASQRAEREKLAERFGQFNVDGTNDPVSGLQRLEGIRNPVMRELCRRMWSAGIEMSPVRLGQFAALWAVGAMLSVRVLGMIGLVAMLGLLLLVGLVLAHRKRSRRRQINAQMPNFLGYLVRALTAGNTLEDGIQSAALESVEPIRGVFLSV